MGSELPSFRLLRALGLAVLAHGALLVWMSRRVPPAPVASLPARPLDVEIEVESPPVPTPEPMAEIHAASSTVQPLETRTAAHGRAVPSEGAKAEPPEEVLSAPPTSTGAGAWTFSPITTHEIGVTAGGGTEAMRSAVRTSLGREEDRQGSGGVKEALDARDHALGLGAGGPLVNLTRDAVSNSLAPKFGNAVFEFRTDGAGQVVSVRVVDASSDRRAWDEVAAALAASARTHPLKVPARVTGSRGVAITMRVESSERTASGHEAGDMSISAFGIPIKKSDVNKSVNVDLALPIAGINIDPTDAVLNATSKPRRVISAWIENEAPL